jgi:hypothetical protein
VNPRIRNGWLVVDCDAPDTAVVQIGLSRTEVTPAFRDYDNGKRVAQVRLPAKPGRHRVYVLVGDNLREAGTISI